MEYIESYTSGEISLSADSGTTIVRYLEGPYDGALVALAALTPGSTPPGPIKLWAEHPDDPYSLVRGITIRPFNVVEGVKHAKIEVNYGPGSGLTSEDIEIPDPEALGYQSDSLETSTGSIKARQDFNEKKIPPELDVLGITVHYSRNLVVGLLSRAQIFDLLRFSCCVNDDYWYTFPPNTWLFEGPQIHTNSKGYSDVVLNFGIRAGRIEFGETRKPEFITWNENQLFDGETGEDYELYEAIDFERSFGDYF